MKRTAISIVVISLLGISCLRLDDQFFNVQPLTEYGFDQYTGERELMDMPDSIDLDDNDVHLFHFSSDDQGDVQEIYAVYLGNLDSIASDTVIVYCHGNKWHMDNYWNRAKLLANVNGKGRYGVLMMDYRGYGMSTGTTTESGMYRDVSNCLQWLKDRGLTDDRLILYGYSLGSASATKWSAEQGPLKPSKLILEAPFSSSTTMIQDASLMAFPSSYFTNITLNNGEVIQDVEQPLCWLHGINDDFLQISTHGEVVYQHHQGVYKEAHRIAGAVHNDVPAVMGYQEYLRVLGAFIRK